MALKTDYVDAVLDTSENTERVFDILDSNGNVIYSNVHLEEKTVYDTVGSPFGALDTNAITKALTDETADVSFQFGIDGNGDYGYIKDGETAVTPFKTRHTETFSPTSRANNLDMGLYHKKRYVDTTAVPNTNSGTYKPTQRKNNNDMGATNTYRYVDTTSVPNSNSQTYSVTSNGTKDMGETNIYRYVSVNVSTEAVQNFDILTYATMYGTSGTWMFYQSNGYTNHTMEFTGVIGNYNIVASGTQKTIYAVNAGTYAVWADGSFTKRAVSANTALASFTATSWHQVNIVRLL